MKKLVSKLNDALNNVKKIDNNVLVSLYNIRDLDIKEINNILGRYNFDSVINDKLDSLYENKYGLSIDKEDIRLFISLLDSTFFILLNIVYYCIYTLYISAYI